MQQFFDNHGGMIGMYIMAAIPVVLFMIAFIIWGNPNDSKPKTISRKKTKQLVRKAVKANEIPQQFRRYNF